MKTSLSREQALELLKKYNKEPFHILHALTVEGVMRWYADELGYGAVSYTHLDVYKRQSFIRAKSPTKCDAQLTESNFQTRSSTALH